MRGLILILLFSVSTMYSQITNAEYYFDTEPSIGNGTAIAVTSGNTINETINIDVSSLSTGFHTFYVRTKNVNNVWSLYDKNVFYISEAFIGAVSNITDAEYYFDTEPGVGNGTAISVSASGNINETINVDISSLSTGFHVFYVRTKNAANEWSLYDKNVFYISEIASTIASPIVAAEYFIDTHVAVGNGTAITLNLNGNGTFDTTISPTGLNEGDHLLFIRTQNNDGVWSLYDVVPFIVDNTVSISDNDLDLVGFNYYPNPITDMLQLTAKEKITQISIYNMLGQEVKRSTPSQLTASVNMSNLANGAYFLRAQVGTHTGTFKIIKK